MEANRLLAIAVVVSIAGSACTAGPSAPPSPSPSAREVRWAEDVAYLVDRIESVHPDPDHSVSGSDLHEAANALVAELPDLDDDEVLVGLMRLLALVGSGGGDGHMGLWPPDNPQAVRRFPIRVWQFPEGQFVTAARAPNEDLVGSRIVSVDGLPIEEVLRRLDPIVPHDNASNLRDARTVFLTSAEVLSGLGIARDPATMELEVASPEGARRTATVHAVDAATYADWVGGWELLLPERPGLGFLRDAADPFRLDYVRPSRALVVRYNVVEETSSSPAGEIEAAIRDRRVDRVVLDLRSNGGGEAGGYRDLLRLLTSRAVDRAGPLFVLIGRLTFSGAASLAVLLERRAADAVFVGEATGGAPNLWADPVTVTLPNSRLNVLIPDAYFGIGGPGDLRSAIEPDLSVPLTASDYFSGHDPVLERALAEPAS